MQLRELLDLRGPPGRPGGMPQRIAEDPGDLSEPVLAADRAGGVGEDAVEDSFDIDDYTRWRLLEGLDDIGITLGHDDDIAVFETTRPSWKPVTL